MFLNLIFKFLFIYAIFNFKIKLWFPSYFLDRILELVNLFIGKLIAEYMEE